MQRALVPVEHDQPLRGETGELPAQLASDAAAGAGHQNRPTGEIVRNLHQVRLNLMTTQQIRLGQISNLRRGGRVELFIDRRKHLDPQTRPRGEIHEFVHGARTGRPIPRSTTRWHRNWRRPVGVPPRPPRTEIPMIDSRCRSGRSSSRRDRNQSRISIAKQGDDRSLTILTDAVDNRPLGIGTDRTTEALERETPCVPDSGHTAQAEYSTNDDHTLWNGSASRNRTRSDNRGWSS